MTAILRYDAACRAIAEAKTVDEVTGWIDKAAAVREYGRRIKNRQMEIDAVEIRVRAKKRRGELLLAMKERGQLREGRKKLSSVDDSFPVFSLQDLQITPDESSEEQRIAAIEGNSFERLVARCRAHAEANPKLHSFNVLKPPPECPINGARAIMGSRVEPDDSLDYFPTPPWATRALIERALPELPAPYRDPRISTAWEPACGEGHIADVLADYFKSVHASDVHDYGYGSFLRDFLNVEQDHVADWIITNPPFGDKAEAFTLRALQLARVGVAMFVRQQWLEGINRFETIFQPHPPALIAQFSERVPLCKGRWDPDGSTATSYVWIVWLRKYEGDTKFFWLPPDCRAVLTKTDDRERFTTQPVTRRTTAPPVEALVIEPSTGEVLDEVTVPAAIVSDGLDLPEFLVRT